LLSQRNTTVTFVQQPIHETVELASEGAQVDRIPMKFLVPPERDHVGVRRYEIHFWQQKSNVKMLNTHFKLLLLFLNIFQFIHGYPIIFNEIMYHPKQGLQFEYIGKHI
jgi:hypothetical protein